MQKNSGSAIGASKFRIINSASEKDKLPIFNRWSLANCSSIELGNRRILQDRYSFRSNYLCPNCQLGLLPRSLWLAHDGFSVAFNKKQRWGSFIYTSQSGDLGFEEFGVSEGFPLVPNTFTNLKFTINWETESLVKAE